MFVICLLYAAMFECSDKASKVFATKFPKACRCLSRAPKCQQVEPKGAKFHPAGLHNIFQET